FMRSTLISVYIIGESVQITGKTVVILQSNSNIDSFFFCFNVYRLMQNLAGLINILHERGDPPFVMKNIFSDFLLAFIPESDMQTFIQKSEFPQAIAQNIIIKCGCFFEYCRI